jgi:catechol-2,3-dioxygenase
MNPLQPRCLGHVVLNVSSLAVSSAFYCEVLGLREVAQSPERRMVFLSFGINDHDVALRQVERTADAAGGSATGVRQVAFRIGSRIEELRGFKAHLEAHAIPIARIHEHIASTSIYFSDPDGVELEAYVEHPPETWRGAAQAQRFSRPLRLD